MIKAVKRNKGFTLVELIVVMAVLAVISAIAVPRFLGIQEEAKEEADYATAAMLGKAAELYLVDDDNLISSLNDAISVAALQDELKTTDIKFVSKKFIGNESTINFTEDEVNGAVIVEAADTSEVPVVSQLYPRLD